MAAISSFLMKNTRIFILFLYCSILFWTNVDCAFDTILFVNTTLGFSLLNGVLFFSSYSRYNTVDARNMSLNILDVIEM